MIKQDTTTRKTLWKGKDMTVIVYKVISRKYDPEGSVIDVVLTEKEALEYNCEIEAEYFSWLESKEKDMLIENMIIKMQELMKER